MRPLYVHTSIRLFLFTFSVIQLCSIQSRAQYDDMGIQFGVSRYKGELSPHLFDTKFIHPTAGIFYRHNFSRHWSAKGELNYAKVSADDKEQKSGFELNRNLNFFSEIWEASGTAEFNFWPYELGNPDYAITPYLFAGLTAFYFNPKSTLNGNEVELQPLGTEGQGLNGRPAPYNRIAMALPFGGGVKFAIGSFGISLQVCARRTFTDYLDDVSTTYPDLNALRINRGPVAAHFSDPGIYRDTLPTLGIFPGKSRGNSSDDDWYVSGTISFYIRLNSFIKEFCKPFKVRRYS